MLPLTPSVLIHAYEFLRATRPFVGWKLPEADDIVFKVARFDYYGEFDPSGPTISISEKCNGHTGTLLASMAHEMIHLYHSRKNVEKNVLHGREFKREAAKVCRYHGFDPKAF